MALCNKRYTRKINKNMRKKKQTQQERISTLERALTQLYLRVQTNSNIIDKLTHNEQIQENS